MPYIPHDDRMSVLDGERPNSPGELNFLLADQINTYLLNKSRVGYAEFNEVIGVLECLKLEVYRRLAAPYEDIKKDENGDVFGGTA